MTPVFDARRISVVTFDAAGTLLRPHPSVGAVYREIGLRHGCEAPASELEQAFRHAFRTLSKNPLVLDPEARERDFWRRVAADAFGAVAPRPMDDFDALFAELWETFAHACRWRVFPDTAATLATLRTRGYRLGVVSNWDRRLHTVLQETALRQYFDAVVISSEAGAEKPDAGIFRAAERALGATGPACLHIGDSRHHDLAGARAAGWAALVVRHDDQTCSTEEIANLASLATLLPGPLRAAATV
jgi:putative hydrolase of the HAD superfamily